MSTSLSVRLQDDALVIGPVRVSFHRTLRVPAEGAAGQLPGLGAFPLRRVEDHPRTAPAEWLARGGFMLPMYQREAMWVLLSCDEPAALQVGAGDICAVTGGPWTDTLAQAPQNYVALPEQQWLDGIATGGGYLRQFVAPAPDPASNPAPAPAQADPAGGWAGTGTGTGGVSELRLRAVGLGDGPLAEWHRQIEGDEVAHTGGPASALHDPGAGWGVEAGTGQEIFTDPRGVRQYDEGRSGEVTVYLCSVDRWSAITGEAPPPTPLSRAVYARHGPPWEPGYDCDSRVVPPHADRVGAGAAGRGSGRVGS